MHDMLEVALGSERLNLTAQQRLSLLATLSSAESIHDWPQIVSGANTLSHSEKIAVLSEVVRPLQNHYIVTTLANGDVRGSD